MHLLLANIMKFTAEELLVPWRWRTCQKAMEDPVRPVSATHNLNAGQVIISGSFSIYLPFYHDYAFFRKQDKVQF